NQCLVARHDAAEGVAFAGQTARDEFRIAIFLCGHFCVGHHTAGYVPATVNAVTKIVPTVTVNARLACNTLRLRGPTRVVLDPQPQCVCGSSDLVRAPDRGHSSRNRDTRRKILRAAFEEFYKNGFQGGSLNNIVDAAGVTKGALF